MAEPKAKPATYADIEALPPNIVGEIIFGALVTHPRPAPKHGGAASALGMLTGSAYQFGRDGPGGWVFVDEPELHLGPHVLVPDIGGWRRERLANMPDAPYFETPPDWLCEVLSPSTEKYDRGDKRRIYGRFGVGHLWFVDPVAQVLEVFERQGEDWLLTHTFVEREEVCAPPFGELTFSLGLLWPFDEPDEAKASAAAEGAGAPNEAEAGADVEGERDGGAS